MTDRSAPGLPDIVVTAGRPTPTEVAAVVVALERVAGVRAAASRPPPVRPAWLEAARREAVGAPPVAAPDALRDALRTGRRRG